MTQVGAQVFPGRERLIFWIGLACAICAIVALALLFVFAPKEKLNRSGSTTIRARGGSNIKIDEIASTADTLVDAEKVGGLEIKRGLHDPAGATGRPAVPGKISGRRDRI